MRRRIPSRGAALFLVVLVLTATVPGHAQGGGNGYLFGDPFARLSLRGGYDVASAGGDLFTQVTGDLTLKKSDFSGPALGAEAGFRISDRLELGLDVGYTATSRKSEYRNFLDNKNLPIEQTTDFRRVPVTAHLRAYLRPRGRSVGRLAWIPSAVVPWLGVGGGTTWYRFRQQGDFIDFQTNNVFFDTFESSGWAPTIQGMGGVDFTITPTMALTGDARYTWARGPLGRDFTGFDRIDLSGVSVALGLTFRL